jgi:hypothetical protein
MKGFPTLYFAQAGLPLAGALTFGASYENSVKYYLKEKHFESSFTP